ncbi:hypothetical protein JCM15519_33060 [Fundidesulfovibrio butyratiphilus]
MNRIRIALLVIAVLALGAVSARAQYDFDSLNASKGSGKVVKKGDDLIDRNEVREAHRNNTDKSVRKQEQVREFWRPVGEAMRESAASGGSSGQSAPPAREASGSGSGQSKEPAKLRPPEPPQKNYYLYVTVVKDGTPLFGVRVMGVSCGMFTGEVKSSVLTDGKGRATVDLRSQTELCAIWVGQKKIKGTFKAGNTYTLSAD